MLTKDDAKRAMKLSEAIRLGAMLNPQAFGTLWSFDGASCALGAALKACGHTDDDQLVALFPILDESARPCPQCGHDVVRFGNGVNLDGNVAHLNDDHKWTREQIADWIQGIEVAHEEPKAVDAVAQTPIVSACLPVRA